MIGFQSMDKLLRNIPLLSAAFAFVLAQFLKPMISLVLGNGWKWRYLTTTGGMPSSHSAATAALTVSVGMTKGLASTEFAICVFLSLVIMNDAMNVRYETGKQAEVLNKWSAILSSLHANSQISPTSFKTMIGHSAIQVIAGAILGLTVGSIHTYLRVFRG